MKPVWLGIVFILLYGLFSMKSQAAEDALATDAVFARIGFEWGSTCQGR